MVRSKIKYPILLLLSSCLYAQENTYNFPIVRVIDGDTIVFSAPFLPDPLPKELSLRIYGIDTPEKGFRAQCRSEADSGISSTNLTKELISNSYNQKIVLLHWDKYGGRVLGDVLLDGVSLRQTLISKGVARPYFGGKKESWCLTNPR